MKKIAMAFMISLTTLSYSQSNPDHTSQSMTLEEITAQLEYMTRDYSYGNGCESDRPIKIVIDGDMDMDYHTLELLNTIVIVHGSIINEGPIIYGCDGSEIIVYDNEGVPDPGGNPFEKEISEDVSIKVYPNPATGYVIVSSKRLSSIDLYDLAGRLRKSFKTVVSENNIDVSNLSNGLYLLVLTMDTGEKITKKLIIE